MVFRYEDIAQQMGLEGEGFSRTERDLLDQVSRLMANLMRSLYDKTQMPVEADALPVEPVFCLGRSPAGYPVLPELPTRVTKQRLITLLREYLNAHYSKVFYKNYVM